MFIQTHAATLLDYLSGLLDSISQLHFVDDTTERSAGRFSQSFSHTTPLIFMQILSLLH